jgi:hypothetical protein
MQKIITIILSCIICTSAMGQSINDLSKIHFDDRKKGVLILGAWGIGNAITGAIGLRENQPDTRAFHQMNLGWGLINTGIAGLGYYSAMKGDMTMSAVELLHENNKLKNILLFNAGLDLAYVASGFYLKEREKSATSNKGRLRGFGNSIIMQGAFLFVFDLGMVYHFSKADKQLIELVGNQNGLGIIYRF